MEEVLTILTEQNRILTADVAIIQENYAAMNSMAVDVARAIDQRAGHIEFSAFTGENGRV